MKINKKNFVTEVREVASVAEICENIGEFGQPCLLIVFGGTDFIGEGSFPADLPYITAFAADEPENVPAETRAAFDLVIAADSAEEYTEKLFKDKTEKQIKEINKCFITARTGSQEDILNCESKAFYRLMADKNGGAVNE